MTKFPGESRQGEATVLVSVAEGVATVSLNRPSRLNAINAQLISDLHAALGDLVERKDVASIILTGRGRAFCAGDDLVDMKTEFLEPHALRQSVERLQSISRLIVLRDTPVVAAVQGWAVGGGLSWALNCDVVLFGESAKAFFPEATLGLGVTGGVTSLLPALIGPNRARELLYFGAKLGVREASEWGLISASVRDEALLASARARAEAFRDLPRSATRKLKRLFSDLQRDDFERALANECEALIELVSEMIATQSWPE